MSSFAIGGQSSGDYKETSGRVQLLHVVTRNAIGLLTPDAFTQANPPVVTGASTKSTTLANVTKVGVLGSTVAFTRPDYGNGYHGGAVLVSAAYSAGLRPLGIFLNDSIGNAFENTPGIASGRGPYVHGSGSTVALQLYETKVLLTQNGNTAGTAITFTPGQLVYASANGLITNLYSDAYEANVGTTGTTAGATIMGVVKVAPDAATGLLVIDMRV